MGRTAQNGKNMEGRQRDGLKQYYIYYWHTVSSDQMNYWVWYYDTHPPTQEQANEILEKAIKEIGGGYWQMVQDWTTPTEYGILFRDYQGVVWGWETGIEENPQAMDPERARIQKLKIEDWLEHPEPQRPKDVFVRIDLLRGGR